MGRKANDLAEAKRLEKRVDQAITEGEILSQKNNIPELFDEYDDDNINVGNYDRL